MFQATPNVSANDLKCYTMLQHVMQIVFISRTMTCSEKDPSCAHRQQEAILTTAKAKVLARPNYTPALSKGSKTKRNNCVYRTAAQGEYCYTISCYFFC